MQNPIFNQLYGFLQTPQLWKSNSLFEMEQFEIPNINLPNSDEFYNTLPNLSTQYVLGKRMEIFFKEILKISKNHEVLINNLQIFRDKITLGEIDFIVQNLINAEQLHVELVYKFYVYDPGYQDEITRWIGPNRKDSLHQKIKKLQSQQFALIQQPETAQTLSNYGVNISDLIQEVCFKANLFVPRTLLNNTFPLINNDCIAGYYLKLEEFNAEEFKEELYYIPKKQDWPSLPEHNKTWNSYDEVQEELSSITAKKRAPLVWRKLKDRNYERFFVVWW